MPAASALNVLVVDDQLTMRSLIRNSLQQIGVREISEAADGEIGLRSAITKPVHLIISDFNMPNLDGLDAIRQIRKLPQAVTLSIIVKTAKAFHEDRLRCLDAGMDDFISKPVSPEVLYGVLLKWLEPPAIAAEKP